MATTRNKITEQIRRLAKAGNPSAPSIKEEEVRELVGQVINQLLKIEYFANDLPQGETIPAGTVIAHYPNIEVEQWKDRSRAKLPAIPVRMIRNLGVYKVGPVDYPDVQYIPIPAGQAGFILKQKLINDLLGYVGYEVLQEYVVFTKDLTSEDVDEVDMSLIVMDMAHYGDYDLLPVSADQEIQVIEQVLKLIGIEPVSDKIIDSTSEPTKQKA